MSTIPALAHKDSIRYQQQTLYEKERLNRKKQLKVINEKKRSTHRSATSLAIPFPIFMLTVSAITAGMIVNVAQQALVSQSSYQIEATKKQIQIEQQIQQKLVAQKARLDSPGRIETVAKRQLSMIKAPKTSYLKVAGCDSQEMSAVQNYTATP